MNDIQERIVGIIQEKMKNIQPDEVHQNSRLEDLGISSIIFIQIAVEIEKEFDVQFGHEYLDIGRYETVKDICDYVTSI